jgi:hypothetical protein
MGFPFVGRLADRKREQAEEATKAKEGIDASLITNYCYNSYWLMYIDMPHFALQLSLSFLSLRFDLAIFFTSASISPGCRVWQKRSGSSCRKCLSKIR